MPRTRARQDFLFWKVRIERCSESLECNSKRWLLKHRHSGNTPIPEGSIGNRSFLWVYIVSHSTRPSNYVKFVDSKLYLSSVPLFPLTPSHPPLSPPPPFSLCLSVSSRNGDSRNSLLLRSRSDDDISSRSMRFVFGAFACKPLLSTPPPSHPSWSHSELNLPKPLGRVQVQVIIPSFRENKRARENAQRWDPATSL